LNRSRLLNFSLKKNYQPERERNNNWLKHRRTMTSLSLKRRLKTLPRRRRKMRKPKTLLLRLPKGPHKPKCSLLPTVLLLILM